MHSVAVVVKRFLMVTIIATVFLALASFSYVQFHYAYDMPQSPQPTTGRIYPITASGIRVYVSKKEFDRARFVYDDMFELGFAAALVGFIMKVRFGLEW